jgi:hypothetical protein
MEISLVLPNQKNMGGGRLLNRGVSPRYSDDGHRAWRDRVFREDISDGQEGDAGAEEQAAIEER